MLKLILSSFLFLRKNMQSMAFSLRNRVTRAHPIAPSPLRANAARLSNRPYRLLTQAPQAGPSGDLTRAHPIAPSPLRGKCCAFVQSPYKPSGALTRSHEAAQGGNGTPDPSGVRRMSQGQGGCVQSVHGAAGIIRVGGAACQAAFVSACRIRGKGALRSPLCPCTRRRSAGRCRALGLTLRRRHGAAFFACRGREPESRSLAARQEAT